MNKIVMKNQMTINTRTKCYHYPHNFILKVHFILFQRPFNFFTFEVMFKSDKKVQNIIFV